MVGVVFLVFTFQFSFESLLFRCIQSCVALAVSDPTAVCSRVVASFRDPVYRVSPRHDMLKITLACWENWPKY